MAVRVYVIDEPSDDPWIRAAVDNAPPLTDEACRLIGDAFRPAVEAAIAEQRPRRSGPTRPQRGD